MTEEEAGRSFHAASGSWRREEGVVTRRKKELQGAPEIKGVLGGP